MNYDEDVLGVGNYQHPANQEPEKEMFFESNNLEACLDFYKVTGDCEPLENAISRNELIRQIVMEELTGVIKVFRNHGMNDTADLLCGTRDKLK